MVSSENNDIDAIGLQKSNDDLQKAIKKVDKLAIQASYHSPE